MGVTNYLLTGMILQVGGPGGWCTSHKRALWPSMFGRHSIPKTDCFDNGSGKIGGVPCHHLSFNPTKIGLKPEESLRVSKQPGNLLGCLILSHGPWLVRTLWWTPKMIQGTVDGHRSKAGSQKTWRKSWGFQLQRPTSLPPSTGELFRWISGCHQQQ